MNTKTFYGTDFSCSLPEDLAQLFWYVKFIHFKNNKFFKKEEITTILNCIICQSWIARLASPLVQWDKTLMRTSP